MSADTFLGLAGLIVGVLGVGFALFNVDMRRLSGVWIRFRARRLPKDFIRLTVEYRRADGIKNPVERVAKKDDLAIKLTAMAADRRLDLAVLAATGEPAQVVALAGVIVKTPRAGQARYLIRAAAYPVPPNARWRWMDAVDALAANGLVESPDAALLRGALRTIRGELNAQGQQRVDDALVTLRDAPSRGDEQNKGKRMKYGKTIAAALAGLLATFGALSGGPVDARPARHDAPATSTASGDYYTNVSGHRVHRPMYARSAPSGASARCGDGTYSFSEHHRGTCSHHGGVSTWLP